MTNKEALQSMTEYDNNNLLLKILADGNLTSGATYTSEQAIDLAASKLYDVVAGHPELKEGSRLVKYNPLQLRNMAKDLRDKWGVTRSGVAKSNPLDGTAQW